MTGLLTGWILGSWWSHDHWTSMQTLKEMWFEFVLLITFAIVVAFLKEDSK